MAEEFCDVTGHSHEISLIFSGSQSPFSSLMQLSIVRHSFCTTIHTSSHYTFVLVFFAFNPWDLYYQGWKNNNNIIIIMSRSSGVCDDVKSFRGRSSSRVTGSSANLGTTSLCHCLSTNYPTTTCQSYRMNSSFHPQRVFLHKLLIIIIIIIKFLW